MRTRLLLLSLCMAAIACVSIWSFAQQPVARPADVPANVIVTCGAVRVVIDPRGSVTVFHAAGGAVSTRPGMTPGESVTELAAPVRAQP